MIFQNTVTLSVGLVAGAWQVYADNERLIEERMIFLKDGTCHGHSMFAGRTWGLNAGSLEIFDEGGGVIWESSCAQYVNGLIHIFIHNPKDQEFEVVMIENSEWM